MNCGPHQPREPNRSPLRHTGRFLGSGLCLDVARLSSFARERTRCCRTGLQTRRRKLTGLETRPTFNHSLSAKVRKLRSARKRVVSRSERRLSTTAGGRLAVHGPGIVSHRSSTNRAKTSCVRCMSTKSRPVVPCSEQKRRNTN